ncbi:MAG: DUF58 domain-containing protein [Armatimonadetes bacterium]|nr:DUF58 domain-containing protein [Armatimonadota bacterium]
MLSGRGKGLLLGIVFLIVVGTLLNIAELFVMASGLAALALFSYVLTKGYTRHLSLSCACPGLVPVGQPFELIVTLDRARAPEYLRLHVSLDLPEELDLIEVEKSETSPPSPVSWRCQMQANARGEHSIGHITVNIQDPVGLYMVRNRTLQETEVLAWPQPLDPHAPKSIQPARQNTAGMNESGQRAMDGSSPYSVREWAPGDTLRRVHWPYTARMGHLAVMEFENEVSRDLRILLDERAPRKGSDGRERFEVACSVASFLLHQAWSKNHQSSVLAGNQWLGSSGLSPEAARQEALSALALAQPESKETLEMTVRQAFSQEAFSGTTVLVCCHWDEDAKAALGVLQSMRGSASALLISGDQDSAEPVVSPLPETRQGLSGVYIVGKNDHTRQ